MTAQRHLISLQSHLVERSHEAIREQARDGSMPAGHNGPYGDAETPVRNTAHWLAMFCQVGAMTGSSEILQSAHRATDYLVSSAARPMKAAFFCRTNPHKDTSNGLIGQAWAIEGLLAAHKHLGREDARTLAVDTFHAHPFDEYRGIWNRLGVDGTYLSPDATFNHQLWFAAIGASSDDDAAKAKATRFIERGASRIDLYQDGVIFHLSALGPVFDNRRSSQPVREVAQAAYALIARTRSRKKLHAKSVGYQGFNLYALGILKTSLGDAFDFPTRLISRMMNATEDASFLTTLRATQYGFAYNPAGIELAFAGECFGKNHSYSQRWLDAQGQATFDHEGGWLTTRGSPDIATSRARLYEASRLRGDYLVCVPDP